MVPSLHPHAETDPQLGSTLLHSILRLVAGRVKATEEQVASLCGVQESVLPHGFETVMATSTLTPSRRIRSNDLSATGH